MVQKIEDFLTCKSIDTQKLLGINPRISSQKFQSLIPLFLQNKAWFLEPS